MPKYILSCDQGTSSSRAVIWNKKGELCAIAQQEFAQIYPKESWVEHDPQEIWKTQHAVIKKVITKLGINAQDIAAFGITNQRETTIIWDRKTGIPIYNAIVWQDRRTAQLCDELKAKGYEALFTQKTGLLLDPYFSGTKIKWILDNIKGARKKAESGELAFGTIDTWLIYQFTQGKLHVTDMSNASRTLLFNINNNQWDTDLLSILNIPSSMLPTVTNSSGIIGNTASSLYGDSIPIASVIGDQQAATMGNACTEAGMLKATYGTGCFMMMNTGNTPTLSKNNLLTTILWSTSQLKLFALEGSSFICGALIQWLRDELSIIKNASEIEILANTVTNNGGVVIVPALTGLGAPHWDPYARGLIIGLNRGTHRGHIAYAALEAIALQTYDIVKAMEADSGIKITKLRADGGASNNNLLMQIQADILNIPIERPEIVETTALGAAYLAGIAVGFWQSEKEVLKQWQLNKRFEPQMPKESRKKLIHNWHRAVELSKGWIEK